MRRDIADRSELSIAEQANCMKVGRHAMDLNFEGFVFKVVSTIGGTSISCHRDKQKAHKQIPEREMSAVVGEWIDEVAAKLKEKFQAGKPFLSMRPKKEQQFPKEGRVEEKEASKHDANETIMSEGTVCMLMDRFVPW
ncbi:hypothetical protein V6N11_027251 [Hibiscus sabdariffa]|uniref:Uncharacterized protein n=1 Tax=Hibiscus sabdariffa TaxID=183260 RepID=A0ABR2PGE2_9ROSI